MDINELAVLVCAVISMPLGAIWYGPLFGKKWMEITGASHLSKEECDKRAKEATPLYGIQFVLTLFQAYVLAHFIQAWQSSSGMEVAMWILMGFVMPTLAGGAMWNGNTAKIKWAQFWITFGFQLLCFAVFGVILGSWK